MDGDQKDLAEEFGEKHATQIMIFRPHVLWAENNNISMTDSSLSCHWRLMGNSCIWLVIMCFGWR